MRKILFICFLLASGFSFSQTITGTVVDKDSGLPLPFANVFVNNTTIGAATDSEGRFRISGEFSSNIELVASFVGYITEVKTVSVKEKAVLKIDFQLAFNESNLSEVELKAKRDKSWERNLKMFKEVFLAVPDDPYGRDIEILNPWVLDFERVKPEKGYNYIKASADLPLKLSNKALGYEIDYYLQDFRMLRNASRFFGQAFYREIPAADSLSSEVWKLEKELNYRNSVRHLALSLLLKNFGSQGYELYQANPGVPKEDRTNDFYYELKKSIIPVMPETIYTKPLGNGTYRIFLPDRIEVHHLTKTWPSDYYTNIYHAISWILAPSGYFDVDRSGILLHPTQLVLSGYMGRQRMARALPLDFMPKEGFDGFIEDFQEFQGRYLKLNRLREKPWLSTNKVFYYPGETLWFGGMMNYQNSSQQDSLSRVVYVDILNDKLKTVFQGTFPIERGRISGGVVLQDSLEKGNYLLRAYTRWSLNFGERDIFEFPFPILDTNELVEVKSKEAEDFYGELEILPKYSVQDSLTFRLLDLELKFRDEFENPVDAEFLLSALDAKAAADPDSKYQLENELDWLDVSLPETFDSELAHPVEYGISVEGKYFSSKKRGELALPITLVLGDLEDFGVVNSDSSGRFWASGFYYKDTAQIAIAALDEKLKSTGSVSLVEFTRPIFKGSFPSTKYTLISLPVESESFVDRSNDYILLEEFVKEEDQVKETMADRNYGYGEPTQEVGPEDLEKLTMAEIFGKLRLKGKKFGNYNYGESVGAPLIIVDGQSFPFLSDIEYSEMLDSFEPSQLKSIKVYSDNISKSIFGMAGYSGVIMIETKNGFRTGPNSDKKFNSEGFQIFPVVGFSDFPAFPNNPPSDSYLKRKPTLYWEPLGTTENGTLKVKIKVPYGLERLAIKVEGRTPDGEAFSRTLPIDLK
ncbi:carboxypeptidase-like regulatory domain-containing protein [Algoriphagus litoralis]|uniref:carboxypeptidase-like regulatory domain-containing protein n=1 Tax=Algoriphagus litoralis TaxID=2202829 RepID=UPI000DBA5223|nr:carboxypeptidase-like regulatory domain-containing protein [Algoriphagus litoralis]